MRNSDLKILIDVESFLHDKAETEEEKELFIQYWNVVERACQQKDKHRKISRDFNNNNKEYHRLSKNLCYAKKVNNEDKIKKYQKLLKEYKIQKAKNIINEVETEDWRR